MRFQVNSILLAAILLSAAALPGRSETPAYPDPARFEDEIRAFEAADRENPPPENAILCIGSSSMKGWHSAIEEDLAPLTVIPRGFGGSNMNDVLHFADRIVIPYRPRAILLYEGDNDTAAGIPHERILDTFHQFVAKVREELPECRIYVLSIKPSIARWNIWPQVQEMNQRFREASQNDPLLSYVDVTQSMLNRDGEPRPSFFVEDDLHMTRLGYEAWSKDIRPILLYEELQYKTTAKQ